MDGIIAGVRSTRSPAYRMKLAIKSWLQGVTDVMPEARPRTLSFNELQHQLRDPFDQLDKHQPDTIIILPSMTMDRAGLAKLPGVRHYEERLLTLLQVLRRPTARAVYISSDSLAPVVVEYALDLISSMPNWHARRRLTMLDCADREPLAHRKDSTPTASGRRNPAGNWRSGPRLPGGIQRILFRA